MNPKIWGILLLVIGAGVAVYFYSSGGAARLGSAFSPPGGNASSTTSSTIGPVATSTAMSAASSTAATSSQNPFVTFFEDLFGGGGQGGLTLQTVPTGTWDTTGDGGSGYSSSNPQGSVMIAGGSTIPTNEIPTGFTAAQLSPYFHDVRLAGVSAGEISLYTYGNYSEPTSTVDITGWDIKTNNGGEYIPQAVNVYNPSGAPVLSDIVLAVNANQYVYLYSNSSPVNLRLNECMGYLSSESQFNPSLPYNCPSVNQAQISSFTGQCQNYIESLGCSPVDMSNPEIPRTDYACQQYLENNFTYDSCVNNHDADPNFLSNEWYVWMGSSPINTYHDNVELLDKNGLLVDIYSY